MGKFRLLKIRTSIDIFKNEMCKVTFGLEYMCEPQFLSPKLRISRDSACVHPSVHACERYL